MLGFQIIKPTAMGWSRGHSPGVQRPYPPSCRPAPVRIDSRCNGLSWRDTMPPATNTADALPYRWGWLSNQRTRSASNSPKDNTQEWLPISIRGIALQRLAGERTKARAAACDLALVAIVQRPAPDKILVNTVLSVTGIPRQSEWISKPLRTVPLLFHQHFPQLFIQFNDSPTTPPQLSLNISWQ